MAGSFAGKAIVQRVSVHAFQHLLDVLLLCSGLSLLWAALRRDGSPPLAPLRSRFAPSPRHHGPRFLD